MRYAYPCVLNPEEGGGFYVVFPDVRGALTCGADTAEALEMAEDALVAILAVHVHKHMPLPIPSPVSNGQYLVPVPPIPAAKLALYTAMRAQGIGEAALGEQLGMDVDAVRKLINPDRYTHITRVMEALRVVGRSLIIEDFDDGDVASQTERVAESETEHTTEREPERAAALVG